MTLHEKLPQDNGSSSLPVCFSILEALKPVCVTEADGVGWVLGTWVSGRPSVLLTAVPSWAPARVQMACAMWHVANSLRPRGLYPAGSSVHGALQARICSGLPCPPPGDLPDPGIKATSPALAGGCFTTEPPGNPMKPHGIHSMIQWMLAI